MKLDRKLRATILVCAAALSASALLIACGGGSSGGGSSSGGGGASSVPIGGTISVGAAWPQGTHVVVTDSTGATVCDTTTALDDGIYSCAIAPAAKAPLVITATHPDKEPLVSVVAALTPSTVNVNSATHAVAALLVNGDPNDETTGIVAQIQTPSGSTLASPTAVAAQETAVLNVYTLLAPDAMKTAANPFTGTLTTNGTGMDAVLDNVKIIVTPTGSGAATMSVTTTATRDESTEAPAPLVLTLAGKPNEAAPAPSTVVTPAAAAAIQVTTANAVASGTTGQINDLLTRMTACYAEPQSTRVDNTNAATAVATNIVSNTCKGLFLNNDPSKYKDNGYVVRGNQAFPSIFTNNTGLGVQFSQGSYEFTVKNAGNTDPTKPMTGDVVFTAKWVAPFDWTDSSGVTTRLANSNVEVYTARPDANGKLFLTGNLSNVDVSIEPRAEFKDFTHADFSKYSYINTGYSVFVNAKHNFGKVVVTTPKGNTLTLKQIVGGGYGYMGLSKPSDTGQYTAVTTSVLRMAAAYTDPSTTSSSTYCSSSSNNHPRDIDGSLFWTCDNNNNQTTPKNWTDEELATIPDQGTWKFDLYTNWNDTTPVGTTYRRTLRRAPTLAEITLSLPKWPSLTADMRTQITAASAATGGMPLSYNTVGKYNVATSTGGAAWQIPSAAKWAPKSVRISGKDALNANAGFDDSVDVYSSWRKATIGCSSSGGTDQHCEMSNGVSTGNFRLFDKAQGKGAGFGLLQFNGYDARRVNNTLAVSMRKS
ncbi:MAG: hypothetical protein QM533_04210 [Cytophagales bacterium]|nr:hypothetical protein [Cytophagales bacterium]